MIDSGELVILGIAQEQHAERTKLYKQWKQYEFPIVQDATTSMNLAVVPVPILVDEHGVVRETRPKPNQLANLVGQEFQATDSVSGSDSQDDQHLVMGNERLHQKDIDIDGAVAAFQKAVEKDPQNAKAMFSLGVAHRMRFDSPSREPDDFKKASDYWSKALAINPNQYIWRRRIEQYGPRLTKPYPFYNWVDKAKKDISARGEEPVDLTVELTGSEVAKNGRWSKTEAGAKNPDPASKIFMDKKDYLSISSTSVPATVKKGEAVRVHLELEINDAYWNDEATPIQVWINESSTGTPEHRLVEFARDSAPSETHKKPSDPRTIDFEFRTSKESSECLVSGYVLFHCCDDEGVCYYFRKNFKTPIDVKQ